MTTANCASCAPKRRRRRWPVSWRRYQPVLSAGIRRRRELQTALDTAIAEDGFRVVYQPIVELAQPAAQADRITSSRMDPLGTVMLALSRGIAGTLGRVHARRRRAMVVLQKSIFALSPSTTEVSATSSVGVISCRSGVMWHHGVTPTL